MPADYCLQIFLVLKIIYMNTSTEIALFSFFFLQLFLSIINLKVNMNHRKIKSPLTNNENQEDGLVPETFTGNCRKYFLTSREIEILKLVSNGLPYKLIAHQLCISQNTVNTHIKNMFTKVDVTNKMELVSRIVKG